MKTDEQKRERDRQRRENRDKHDKKLGPLMSNLRAMERQVDAMRRPINPIVAQTMVMTDRESFMLGDIGEQRREMELKIARQATHITINERSRLHQRRDIEQYRYELFQVVARYAQRKVEGMAEYLTYEKDDQVLARLFERLGLKEPWTVDGKPPTHGGPPRIPVKMFDTLLESAKKKLRRR